MKKYIVFGYTNADNLNTASEPNEEERKGIFGAWMKWQEIMGDKLVSMGSPLINGRVVNKDGVVDKEVSNLSGYMIIKANDQITH